MAEQQIDPVLRGSLLIYVDGFHVNDFNCEVLNHGHKMTDPDPGEMNWYLAGWAVGNNSRDKYCSRNDSTKVRRFKSYDAAVEYIYRKQRKRPQERYSLVYELNGLFQKVASLDEILALDAKVTFAEDTRRADTDELYPELYVLQAKVNRVVAFKAAYSAETSHQ